MPITASKLYDYLQCAHRPWRDAWGPQAEKNPETNPFVEMLWEKGTQYEKEVIGALGDYFDASQGAQDERVGKWGQVPFLNRIFMIEHIVLAALVLYALYRIEHHGYHTKRVLMAIRDIMKHDHS